MATHVIEIKNAELMAELTQRCKELAITHAAVVSLIGAVDSFTISTMPAHDATQDIITTYELPAEMTGTGEIIDSVPHLHAVMAVEGDKALGGHLHRANIRTWFVRAYLHVVEY